MLSKNTISYIRSLQQKKFREEHGVFVVEGHKSVMEFLHSDWDVEHLYAQESWMREHSPSGITSGISTAVTRAEMERISGLSTPAEVLAVVKQNNTTWNAATGANSWTLALDGIRDPGNLGTIIRIADWFDIPQIVCSADCVELYNPKVVQAAMGSITRVAVSYATFPTFLHHAKSKNLSIYGADMHGDSVYAQELPAAGVLVIGNEANGIREEQQSALTHRISIPAYKNSGAESLNAAVATGILCAEIKRTGS